MWKNISASQKCKKCKGELVSGLKGFYCPVCDPEKEEVKRHTLNQPIIQTIPKIEYKHKRAFRSISEVDRTVEAINRDQNLSLNSTQQYIHKDYENSVLKVSNIFGQDYVRIETRSELDLQELDNPDLVDPEEKKKRRSKPPIIPPPNVPPEPPEIPWIPIPKPQIRNCKDAPIVTVSVGSTTMSPGQSQAIVTNGGVGSLRITIDDPCNSTVPDQTSAGYITIRPDATNVNCLCNITITVEDDCGQIATIIIGINTVTNQKYLVPGTYSVGYGGYGYGYICCQTYQDWQECEGGKSQSSYYCDNCTPCYLPTIPCTTELWQSLCPGTENCGDPNPPGWRESLEEDGCCPGS